MLKENGGWRGKIKIQDEKKKIKKRREIAREKGRGEGDNQET